MVDLEKLPQFLASTAESPWWTPCPPIQRPLEEESGHTVVVSHRHSPEPQEQQERSRLRYLESIMISHVNPTPGALSV
ncbi:hypothetical protein IWQ62_002698 [Dispira parvispora]|uniref:Uncharacterized protein n=1 Tax=Dispira parvispora TaxID=1520584 RepID=A0A9W8AV83_9FUNG|nr:hypothetical protein IWQ62_002698 [Dispira parvispora]